MPWLPTLWCTGLLAYARVPARWRPYLVDILAGLTVFSPWLRVPAVLLLVYRLTVELSRWLQRHSDQEQKHRNAGDFLLLLALEAASGSGVVPAIAAMAKTLEGDLQKACLHFVDALTEPGSLRRPLERLAQSLGTPLADRLAAALVREQALGLSLHTTLERQLDIWRQEEWQQAERRRQRLPYILTVSAALFLLCALVIFGYPKWLSIISGLTFSSRVPF